jgi:hypothetical protein
MGTTSGRETALGHSSATAVRRLSRLASVTPHGPLRTSHTLSQALPRAWLVSHTARRFYFHQQQRRAPDGVACGSSLLWRPRRAAPLGDRQRHGRCAPGAPGGIAVSPRGRCSLRFCLGLCRLLRWNHLDAFASAPSRPSASKGRTSARLGGPASPKQGKTTGPPLRAKERPTRR